ncbi:MAG TPA: prenyltransferase/squalene oxidase repeat-containing protein [Pirellulales bacterium]
MTQSTRRTFLAHSAGLCAASLGAMNCGRADELSPQRAGEMITPEAQRAIDAGLAYLLERQRDDGSLGSGQYRSNVAVCGLAGLAFMASGSTPNRGPFGANVERCIDFLMQNTREDGFINVDERSNHGPMYGHGFAALFLAECYGMTMRTDIRETLAKAVHLIVETQNVEGGWRYQPRREDADISVTICQIMALRAARNAGIYVPKKTVDECTDYVKRCQNRGDGGFAYQLTGSPHSEFPRSAAGVVALYMAGVYDGPELQSGLDYLMQHLPRGQGSLNEPHYFYGHYYAVQAMWHAGGKYWDAWYPAIRDELVGQQRTDGSWLSPICTEYAAAMACIILQLPNNFLPIIQR